MYLIPAVIVFVELLKKITGSLEEKGISYMVSGSLALNVYSVPRMTYDIDLVIELHHESVEGFLQIFREGFYIDAETVREEIGRKGMFNAIDHQSGLKIDFIIRKDTEYRRLEFSRKIRKLIGGMPVWIVSPEDLIISKIIWIQELQSEKQMGDINRLLSLEDIDRGYIKDWCKKLALNTFGMI